MNKEERTTVIVTIIGIICAVVALVFVFLWDSERAKRVELESELFASNKLLFLCESDMQDLYNVPGLGSEIDSILGRVTATDTVFSQGQAVSAGSFGDPSKWVPVSDLNLIDSSEVTGQSEPEMKPVEDYMWIVLDTTALINRIKQQVLDSIEATD